MLKRLFLLNVLAATSLTVYAQVDTGLISGTVHDPAGAVIPSADITITDQSTNVKTVVHTNQEGDYTSPPLKVGTYTVMVETPGFGAQIQRGVTLQVQERRRLDFAMSVGQVSQRVTITDQSPPIQTEQSSLGQVISSTTITALPLNGRDYLQLATLSTGVISTKYSTNGNTGGGNSAGTETSFAANGARGTMNNFLLDGIDNNSNDTGGLILQTNIDAIQEFKIQTNSFSAEFGRGGGAAINAVIKSGTNSYHGNVFEFFRNTALDARPYFEDPTTKEGSFQQNQFGGTIGGPILRDKLFWFGDYQGTISRTPTTFISSVPDAAQRNGDFSGPGNSVIYNPATGTPFTGNVLTGMDPLAMRVMALYPLPNQPGKLKNNYVISPVTRDRIDQGDFRADYNISDRDHAFFRWSMSGQTTENPTPLPGIANGGNSSSGEASLNTMGAALGVTHIFNSSTVNELRIGFNHLDIDRGVPPGGNIQPPSDLLVPGVPATLASGLTLFIPSGYQRVGAPRYAPTILSSSEREITDTLNLVRGKHTIAVGGSIRWSQYNILQVPAPNGQFSFSGQFTENPTDGSGGSSLADWLLGLPISSEITTVFKLHNRQYTPSAFLQDDYKVNRKLTLNLGVRYDFFSPIVEKNNHQSNFDFSTGQLVEAGVNGASRSLVTPDYLNFVPRVGFAYNMRGETVVSAGYGIFFNGQEIRTAAPLQLAYNAPFYYQSNFISDGVTPILTVSGGFPPFSASNALFPAVTSVDSRLKTPYYQQWNVQIQQALPSIMSLSIAYAGSKGTHLQSVTDQNQVRIPGPGDVQSRRPFPEFGSFTSIQNRGNSTYHSAQVKVEKRYSHGLSFLSSLTWSKTINDQPEICCAQPFPQNSYNVASERGLADFHQGLRWASSFDYELPFGTGQRYSTNNRALDLAFGGWHIGGIYALGSGFPFSPQIGFDPSNTGSQGLLRPDQIGIGTLPRGQRSANLWFNPDAYAAPAAYTFGNAGRNSLIGPGINSFDGSLRKLFAMGETRSLQFRAEFFNLMNHPNFAQPDPLIDDGPGAAGVITGIGIPMRQIQLGLKVNF
jgi:hypothetical protein